MSLDKFVGTVADYLIDNCIPEDMFNEKLQLKLTESRDSIAKKKSSGRRFPRWSMGKTYDKMSK